VLDTHPAVASFAKNAGLGFAIPYIYNGQPHDYVPDFIVQIATDSPKFLVLETKGFDELADVKAAAAPRWVRLSMRTGGSGSGGTRWRGRWTASERRSTERRADAAWRGSTSRSISRRPTDPTSAAGAELCDLCERAGRHDDSSSPTRRGDVSHDRSTGGVATNAFRSRTVWLA
jgi:hypothetical protein